MVPREQYRVIVIGGGHAGAEAAWAAANLLPAERHGPGAVALVTLDPSKIGVMSCNPAIGGLAKGQIVREIDALNGLMPLAADLTGIQFKVLNTSRGPAVHGPRCQSDKHEYARTVRSLLGLREEIQILQGSVEDILIERGVVAGIRFNDHAGGVVSVRADAVVLTTGTFMRGLMHTGEQMTPGGRFGEDAAVGISATLKRLGFELGRLKTGTPPRLKKSTIDWDSLEPALGDDSPRPFSDLSDRAGRGVRGAPTDGWLGNWADRVPGLGLPFPGLAQVECRVTRTTPRVHDAIRANLHRAPMYSGQIESVGPRYCPSIEDKVVRFADREEHNVFLEPESHSDDWIYCNGISTSLPADVQDVIVRSMPGCADAHIYRYGYAVEYDMVLPHQIMSTGMTKRYEGLFLAGQINGTSGYEEAAAQGVVAGINAARRSLGQAGVTFARDAAYIGVLMDDLVTKTPTEPYRMFTSRAEHRLLLRADNAADRLTPVAASLGLLGMTPMGRERERRFGVRKAALARLGAVMDSTRLDGRTLAEHCKRVEFGVAELREAIRGCAAGEEWGAVLDDEVVLTAHADRSYDAFVQRSQAEIRRRDETDRVRIPATIDYRVMTHLRAETREALERFRPETIGQAARLEGVTPADVTLLAVLLKRRRDDERAARA